LRRTNGTRTPGKKSTPHRDPTAPPRRRAHTHQGHGTDANDRPPMISVLLRATGEQRFGCATIRTDAPALTSSPSMSRGRAWSSTPMHGRVITGAIQPMPPSTPESTHGPEMMRGTADARVHGNSCEGAGAVRRSAPTCVPSAGSTNSTAIAP
jgi:hypothetical protein